MSWLERRAIWIVVTVFIASGWFTWQELRFRLAGASTTAQIVKIERVPSRSGRTTAVSKVTYRFADDSAPAAPLREETDIIQGSWPPDDARTLDVQYIPGSPESSRASIRQQVWPLVVFPIGLALSIGGLIFLRGYARDQADRRSWTPSKV